MVADDGEASQIYLPTSKNIRHAFHHQCLSVAKGAHNTPPSASADPAAALPIFSDLYYHFFFAIAAL